jgi:hypothetical protein
MADLVAPFDRSIFYTLFIGIQIFPFSCEYTYLKRWIEETIKRGVV